MIIIPSIFGQFFPETLFFVPMNIFSMVFALSWLIFTYPTNWAPSRFQSIWVSFRENVLEMIFQNTSPNTAPWAGLITTVFLIILSVNVLGLFPYAFTATSHISLTYSLGFPLWMAVNILGFYLAFNSRLSHLVPQGTPNALIPLMVWIETLSLFAQPIALGLRLAANLTAGHLLIFLLSTAIWLLSSSPAISIPIFIIFVLLFVLEIGVACIQAYVFTALVHFYLQQNI
uniref:ATP synthase subunit a n=1 Tax=Tripneustes gratilla TaxID=7673 RepID=A0A1W5I6S3_TRIGR|nr:ATP synthase F0 subunit 6 [Tripneustes gratilla]AID60591.1 ATP synthase F0 subunit 6 [Tripneustes gratilla]ARO89829.1 ATP synthase subunit 6 [Tripneustes gratilla]QLM01989.1 ATP synthase F0 subunit 6 [Tripneustes gratilla]WKW91735.1 ATP synthase F0 subunit 6 [Tripneustes gratilla]WKW91748.1 ATP synthase F0 subunit 6 [Tripneustes gratilla]